MRNRETVVKYIAALISSALATLPLWAGDALAQDKQFDLKFSHWIPGTHPIVPATQAWADSIKAASNGTITVTIFPGQQLGKAFDHYNMARDGIADITHANPGYEPGRFPILAAGELPFIVTNGKGGSEAVDAWYRAYAAKEMREVKFCLAFVHDPGTFHMRTKKIVVPDDIKGVKIRPAGTTVARMVTLAGGTNVQASAVEARDLIEKGVADGLTGPWGSNFLFGIDKVVKYHLDLPLYTSVQTWVMNKDKYDAMSAAQKKVIDDHCTTEWALKIASPWADFEFAGRAKTKALEGHEVYSLTSDQLGQWEKLVEPIANEWGAAVSKVGVDPKAALDGLKAKAKEYQSAF